MMRLRSSSLLGFSLVFVLSAACGDDDPASTATSGSHTTTTGAAGDGGSGGDGAGSTSSNGMGGAGGGPVMYPAPHPPQPLVAASGGPVLAHPQVYPVFFGEQSAFETAVADFIAHVGGSDYWTQISQEYGVGPLQYHDPVDLPALAGDTIDDTEIQAWLTDALNANDPSLPAPDDDTLVALYYPSSITITQEGAESCVAFGGYHSNITLDAAHGHRHVAYSVVPHCGASSMFDAIEQATVATSHELLEASTDPYPMDDPAFSAVGLEHIAWYLTFGGTELADMCSPYQDAYGTFPGLDYTVQRSWSNAAAAASHDPCVPSVGGPYFNSSPVFPDMVDIGGGMTTEAVIIPVGGSKTIEVDLFSDADTGADWSLNAFNGSVYSGGPNYLELSFDESHGRNGDKLALTIHVTSAPNYMLEPFFIVSSLGQKQALWAGLVVNQ